MKTIIKILLAIVLVMIIIGSIMVLSASGAESLVKFDSFFHLFKNHITKVIFAVVTLVISAFIPYRFWGKYSKTFLMIIIGILIITLFAGSTLKGARRWINLGLFSFQPAELAKIFLLIHLSSLAIKKGDLIKDFKRGFVFMLFWIYSVAFLILIQPNFSTAFIIVLLSFTLLFAAGARIWHLSAAMISSAAAAIAPILIIPHVRRRMFSFLSSIFTGASDSYQLLQAKVALGSGGLWGVGLGHSRQSNFFLPEPYGDFIFSILGEETGFLGAVIILSLYMIIFAIGLIIAFKAKDKFGRLTAFALSFNIIFSAYINVGVVTGIFPPTGITLPFISYGGTSLIVFCASIGILLNIGYRAVNNKILSTESL